MVYVVIYTIRPVGSSKLRFSCYYENDGSYEICYIRNPEAI